MPEQSEGANDAMRDEAIIPLYKSGSQTLVSKYRPITLSVFNKMMEKLMYIRIIINFLDNRNLNENQFGFGKGNSTTQVTNYAYY